MRVARKVILASALIAAAALAAWIRFRPEERQSAASLRFTNLPRTISGKPPSPEIAAEFLAIEAREKEAETKYWAAEMLAQECGRTVEQFWDALNASTNKWATAAEFEAGDVLVSSYASVTNLPHGIVRRLPGEPRRTIRPAEWAGWLQGFRKDGWELSTFEFRHNQFETNAAGAPATSRFHFAANLTNSARPERATLDGVLIVDWGEKRAADGFRSVRRVDATALHAATRSGAPPFRPVLDETIEPDRGALSIDPLIVYDLDRDGYSEIILGAKNLVYRRVGPDRYRAEPLCQHAPGPVSTALIADFDGDGAPDFLAQKFEGLLLFRGAGGRFDEAPRVACAATKGMEFPMAMTCGDVESDGDLDVFIGQYRDPYEDGAVPTPFYDANDGHPAYLLLNDGKGNFTDATEASGLAAKRFRRSYSASFLGLGWGGGGSRGIESLGLAVICDFAGLDLHANDGFGKFTERAVKIPQAFGMAHCVSDFDNDGLLDLLMTGMTSPTVERLNHLGLVRPGIEQDLAMRARMTHGNRLYLRALGESSGTNLLTESIARSGWSWGCTAPDIDNDGFADVFIVNGLESNASTRDYESEYWLHDRYAGGRTNSTAALLYFQSKFTKTRGSGMSYGGYEKNRLFLNRGGQEFVEIGHLFGVASEEDSRNAVSDDLDGDGRIDLIYTTLEIWPKNRQRLVILKNELPDAGNWIAFRGAPVGARIVAAQGAARSARTIVTGDSFGSQHSGIVRFGLGDKRELETVEFQFPRRGSLREARGLEGNRVHDVPKLRP